MSLSALQKDLKQINKQFQLVLDELFPASFEGEPEGRSHQQEHNKQIEQHDNRKLQQEPAELVERLRGELKQIISQFQNILDNELIYPLPKSFKTKRFKSFLDEFGLNSEKVQRSSEGDPLSPKELQNEAEKALQEKAAKAPKMGLR